MKKQKFSATIFAVFSAMWSFRNHSMLIWLSILKTLVETVIFFQDSLMNRKFKAAVRNFFLVNNDSKSIFEQVHNQPVFKTIGLL